MLNSLIFTNEQLPWQLNVTMWMCISLPRRIKINHELFPIFCWQNSDLFNQLFPLPIKSNVHNIISQQYFDAEEILPIAKRWLRTHWDWRYAAIVSSNQYGGKAWIFISTRSFLVWCWLLVVLLMPGISWISTAKLLPEYGQPCNEQHYLLNYHCGIIQEGPAPHRSASILNCLAQARRKCDRKSRFIPSLFPWQAANGFLLNHLNPIERVVTAAHVVTDGGNRTLPSGEVFYYNLKVTSILIKFRHYLYVLPVFQSQINGLAAWNFRSASTSMSPNTTWHLLWLCCFSSLAS